MKVIVEVDHTISKEEVQSWIDDVLLKNPCVYSAHIACSECKCDKEATLDNLYMQKTREARNKWMKKAYALEKKCNKLKKLLKDKK